MNVLVELDASKLIPPIVHDLQTGGATPVIAIERALEAHTADRLKKFIGMNIEAMRRGAEYLAD